MAHRLLSLTGFLLARCAIAGTTEDADRHARRQVRVTKEHKSEVQRLLKLMGIPFHDVRAINFPAPC